MKDEYLKNISKKDIISISKIQNPPLLKRNVNYKTIIFIIHNLVTQITRIQWRHLATTADKARQNEKIVACFQAALNIPIQSECARSI